MEERELRVRIIVEEVGRGMHKQIGERYCLIGEQMYKHIQPLPDDREIMELAKDDSIWARIQHEKNMEMAEKRWKAIQNIGELITREVKIIIESQDKINGYPQEKSNG